MIDSFFRTVTLFAFLLIVPGCERAWAQAPAPAVKTEGGAFHCKIIETLNDPQARIRVVIFHQRDKADGPRLGAFLADHAGEEMELAAAGGQHYLAPVFRVRSAFGRGLVLVPAGKINLGEHDEFTLSLAPTIVAK